MTKNARKFQRFVLRQFANWRMLSFIKTPEIEEIAIMQVKIGTKYKLGNGDIVTIVAVNPDVRDPYQYAVGWLDNAIESWSKEGRYCPSIPKSKLNIVSEIP